MSENSKEYTYAKDLPRWSTEEAEKNIKAVGKQGLSEISRTQANLGSPKPSDTKPTAGEIEILALGEQYINQLKSEARELAAGFEGKVDAINIDDFGKPGFKNIVQNYSTNYRKHKQNILGRWNDFKTKLADKYRDIQEKFDIQNREVKTYQQNYLISREANSASRNDWIKLAIATIVLFSIEVAINRSAVGGVSVGGLNYGLIISVIIATVNVYGSSLIGFAVTKHINDHDKSKRSFYKTVSAIYVVLLVYLNWIYAAYRQVAETSLAEFKDKSEEGIFVPMSAITNALTEASLPWTVQLSVPSIGLLFLGLLFGGFAMYKFYLIDDVIPGYGKIFRKRNNLKDQLEQRNSESNTEKSKLVREWDDVRNKELSNAENAIETTKQKCDQYCLDYNVVINVCQELATKYEERRKACQKGIKHMLLEFRQYNKNIQVEKVPGWTEPSYWADAIKLDDEDDTAQHIFKNAMSLYKTDEEKIKKITTQKDEINHIYNKSKSDLVTQLEEFNKEPELVLE